MASDVSESNASGVVLKTTLGETVLALLKNTIPARRRPKDALARLRSVALAAEALQGTRGEASEMVRQILTQLDWKDRP